MSRIVRRLATDLVDIAYDDIRQGSPATVQRFRTQAGELFRQPANMPGIRTAYNPDHRALAQLPFLPMTRFKKYLVFYRPMPGGIEIIRVLHGARDLHSIISHEFGIAEEGSD